MSDKEERTELATNPAIDVFFQYVGWVAAELAAHTDNPNITLQMHRDINGPGADHTVHAVLPEEELGKLELHSSGDPGARQTMYSLGFVLNPSVVLYQAVRRIRPVVVVKYGGEGILVAPWKGGPGSEQAGSSLAVYTNLVLYNVRSRSFNPTDNPDWTEERASRARLKINEALDAYNDSPQQLTACKSPADALAQEQLRGVITFMDFAPKIMHDFAQANGIPTFEEWLKTLRQNQPEDR